MDREALIDKIKNRDVRVAVFGLGYVGLPLTGNLISQGYEVIGCDPDNRKMVALASGKSYIEAVPDSVVLSWGSRFTGVEDINDFPETEDVLHILISCVPTPLSEQRDPDLSYVESSARDIAKAINKNTGPALAILESTTYPGTTREIFVPIIEELTGRKTGETLFIAYAPEREDPGNQRYSTADIPRVVGADDEISRELASTFYESLVPSIHVVDDTRVAEASKLIENSYRMINISFVNSLKEMFDAMGIDIWDAINAAKTKPFGFSPFFPGPGIGGHCIKIDPYYLTWKAKEFGFTDHFLELAADVNEKMPRFVRFKVAQALNLFSKSVRGSKVLILGAAYKPDIGDLRESAAYPVMEMLEEDGAELIYHDPFCETITLGNGSEYQHVADALETKNLEQTDCVLLLTDHSCFDYEHIINHTSLVVDTRNAFAEFSGKAKVIKA